MLWALFFVVAVAAATLARRLDGDPPEPDSGT